MLSNNTVAIASTQRFPTYPRVVPFRPDEDYPELRKYISAGNERNVIYPLLRRLLQDLRMDLEHFSTRDWNPFREIIRPGLKVLIKPNLVRHLHLSGGDYQAVVTHGSVIRCVLDYVALALKGRGEIIVGDAPVQGADFTETLRRTGLQELCDDVARTWQVPVKLIDFRLSSVRLDDNHRVMSRSILQGDSAGYFAVNLGNRSLLAPLSEHYDKFRVTSYDCREMKKHHNRTRHEYLIPRTILDADVILNLPKLKTHRKVGLTAALKNIVGINGHKDWLPHHRRGSVQEGGDEYLYPSILKRFQTWLGESIDRNQYSRFNFFRGLAIRIACRLAQSVAADPFEEGSWYGNDTCWRMVLDLNRLLVYADREGRMTEVPQRQCLTVVDAIVAGDGEGPMEPDPRPCGFLAGGMNPIAIDTVLAAIIGFDFKKIPLIVKGFEIKDWPLIDFGPDEIEVRSADPQWDDFSVTNPSTAFNFVPSSGWGQYIELKEFPHAHSF